jgi:hypothetical protein
VFLSSTQDLSQARSVENPASISSQAAN